MLHLTREELPMAVKIEQLKKEAGSHSPSLSTYRQKLPELLIKVDACFLSNPYATSLFLDCLNGEIIKTGKLRDVVEFYPSQNTVIAELLGKFLDIDSGNIFIGNGAIEIIQAVIHNFTERKILINIPAFSSYYEFVKEGVEIIFNRLKKEECFQLDTALYLDIIKTEQPDTVVLINPNNPNGAYIKTSEIEFLLEQMRSVKTVILDESFIHFAYEDNDLEMISAGSLITRFPNLVLIKSMSKDFGIAGVRAGYGIMAKEKVKQLLVNGYLWNSNGLAEFFFRLYVRKDFDDQYNKVRKKYIRETLAFIKELELLPGIKIYPGKANFVLVELLTGISSGEFVSLMLIRYGIYVRNCDDKIGLDGEYIRLSSRSMDENNYIIRCFKEYLCDAK